MPPSLRFAPAPADHHQLATYCRAIMAAVAPPFISTETDMNHHFSPLLIAAVLPFAAQAADKAAADLKTDDQRTSYSMGLRYGENFARDYKEINLPAFYQGLEDGFKGAHPKMSQAEVDTALQAFQRRRMEEQIKAQQKAGEANKAASDAFLAKNKTRPGVVTTADGLQYEVLKKGSGASPAPTDKVTVHYQGTLPDGTVFDSSIERGQPATFPVNGVIHGWTEALQLMHVGDKWKLYLPPELAYGARGAGSKIGPNQMLIFEVELLDIAKGN